MDVSATEVGGVKQIRSIDFVNNDTFKEKVLLKELDFESGDYLDPVLAESGRIIISEYYRLKGFADVLITLDSAALSEGNIVYVIQEGPRIKIKSIDFDGNSAIKTSDLRSTIKTETRSWFFWPVYYTQEKIAADLQELRTVYYQRGFLNHAIRAVGREHIIFIIDEGSQYTVGKITVSGNTYFDSEELLEGFELEPGQIYYPQKAQLHAEKILNRYLENGFVNAQIDHQYLFNESGTNVVNIEFSIVEGGQFRIGRIDITGNEQTKDKVYRQILGEYDFIPGSLYNADLAPVYGGGYLERYLQRMTLADEVILSPVAPANGADDSIDVRVSVKEGLTGMLKPGFTVGTDSGVMGEFVFTQQNFDATDWPKSLRDFTPSTAFIGAGQTFRIELLSGTEYSYYSMTFTEPYFQDKPVSFSLAGSSYKRWYESYDEKRKRGYVGFGRRYRNGWRNSIGLRVENVEVVSLDYDAPQEIIDVKGNNLLIGTSFGVELDKTDDPFTPADGYSLGLNYEQVTGEHDFGILDGSTIWYRTLYEDFLERKTVLATKFLAATTVSDAPPFEKFYAGGIGPYGIRGFEYRGISTRGLQTNVPFPVRKDPIGSDWIFLANTELSVPLIGENVSALFFLDSGTIDTGPYRSSVGVGLQILIPNFFGPVPMRFSYAVPMKKGDTDETQHFSFYMGALF